MSKIFTKKEVAELLGVNTSTLRRWTEEKIQLELLLTCCLETLKVQKVGRAVEYTLVYKEFDMDTKEFLKREFKVKKVDDFITYSKAKITSIEKEDLKTKKQICKDAKVAETTSKRYDKKLVEKGVLEKGSFIYVCVHVQTGQKSLVDKKAFDNFWIKSSYLKNELKALKNRFDNKEVDLNEYNYLYSELTRKSEFIYYKLREHVVKYDNELTKLIINN